MVVAEVTAIDTSEPFGAYCLIKYDGEMSYIRPRMDWVLARKCRERSPDLETLAAQRDSARR
jgi:hypothetical protein